MSGITIHVINGKLIPFDDYTGNVINMPYEEIRLLYEYATMKDIEAKNKEKGKKNIRLPRRTNQ